MASAAMENSVDAVERFPASLSIYQTAAAAEDPRPLHARAIKAGGTDPSFFTHLISVYSRSAFRSYASRVFRLIPSPGVVSWTSLISAHTDSAVSLHHFASMHRLSILPTQRTFGAALKACAAVSALTFGLQLHSLSLKLALDTQPFSASALLSFYSKCRLPADARKVFDEITDLDEVCYGSLIGCLAQNSRHLETLSVFTGMRAANMSANMYTMSGALRSAAELAALEQCRALHAHAMVTGIDVGVFVATALIDAYGKSGVVDDARRVFDEMSPGLNLVGWNAMMSGYAQQGDTGEVLSLFASMERRGLGPDDYSFIAVLTALCNAALAVEAEQWVALMRSQYGVEPKVEHYTCLVGALGRAGRLADAERVALGMPVAPDAAIWRALLSCCVFHGEADMAWAVARRLFELNEHDDSAYMLMTNAFAASRKWDEVSELRTLMRRRNVRKEVGRSWIEVKGRVHVFAAGDRDHPYRAEIFGKLEELMEEIGKLGYVPICEEMLHEVGEGEKKEALRHHSEKLALAYGVVSGAAPPGRALRIVKNLRICRDCHEAFKYMGRVVGREIIVRDPNRYHRFVNGVCSCGDIW